jgi:hypothetical protein
MIMSESYRLARPSKRLAKAKDILSFSKADENV